MLPGTLLQTQLHKAQLLHFTSIDVHSATHAITVYDGHYSYEYCGPLLKRTLNCSLSDNSKYIGLNSVYKKHQNPPNQLRCSKIEC